MNFINTFFGIIIGSIVGLIGLHINDILPITFYFGFEFIVSSTISWYFFSLIPSILLRIPENTNFIILNKLNKEVLKGNGLNILENAVFNCYLITILSIFLLIPYVFFIRNNVQIVKVILLLVLISFLKSKKHLFILILCFCLGSITFNTGLELLFPILSGLFAIPVYLSSEKFKLTEQKENKNLEIKKEIFPSLIISSFFSSFPALSSSISAIFSKKINKNLDMVFLMIFSEYTYLILSILYYEKIRSATSFYLNFYNFDFIKMFLIIIFSASFSCFLILRFSGKFNKITKFYKPRLFLVFVIFLTFWIYGFYGLIVLLTSSLIGLLCGFWKIERTTLITTLIFPILLN